MTARSNASSKSNATGVDLFSIFDKEKYASYFQEAQDQQNQYDASLLDTSKKMRSKIDDLFSAFEECD